MTDKTATATATATTTATATAKTTLVKYFNDAVKAEDAANKQVDESVIYTCKVITALAVKEARCKDLPTKKALTERVFKLFKMDKTDSGKSAIYNRVAVIKFMIDNNANALNGLAKTVNELSDSDILNHVLDITKRYTGFKAVLLQAKPKKEKASPNHAKNLITIDKNANVNEIADVIIQATPAYLQDSEKAVTMILNLLGNLDSAGLATVKAKVTTLEKQAKKQAKKAA